MTDEQLLMLNISRLWSSSRAAILAVLTIENVDFTDICLRR